MDWCNFDRRMATHYSHSKPNKAAIEHVGKIWHSPKLLRNDTNLPAKVLTESFVRYHYSVTTNY